MIEPLSQLLAALVKGLEETNQGAKSALASIPDFIEYFIEFVRHWAGLFFLIGIIIAVLDIVLAILWR